MKKSTSFWRRKPHAALVASPEGAQLVPISGPGTWLAPIPDTGTDIAPIAPSSSNLPVLTPKPQPAAVSAASRPKPAKAIPVERKEGPLTLRDPWFEYYGGAGLLEWEKTAGLGYGSEGYLNYGN